MVVRATGRETDYTLKYSWKERKKKKGRRDKGRKKERNLKNLVKWKVGYVGW